MEEQKEHCPNVAEYIVPWAGKLHSCCEAHANRMCKIGEVMGAPIQVKRIVGFNTLKKCEGKQLY